VKGINNDLSQITDAYKLIVEASKDPKAKFGTKPGKPQQDLPSHKDSPPKQPFLHKDSGPQAADGVKTDLVDPKNKSKKENHFEPEKFSTAVEKNSSLDINNNMSNKSIFDKLYETVMGEEDLDKLDAQELGVGDETGAGEEGAGDERSPSEILQSVIDELNLLKDKLGAGDEEVAPEVGAGEGLPAEDEQEKCKKGEEEEKEEVKEEAVEAEERGHALVGSGVKGGAPTSPKGSANVVGGPNTKPSGGKASGETSGEVDGGKPKAAPAAKAGNPKGSAVVQSKIKGKNQELFKV